MTATAAVPDLFWTPSVGDLVEFKPGSHAWDCQPEADRKHPLKVVKPVKSVAGRLMTWVQPTGSVKTITKGGATRQECPTWQQPCLVEELMPHEGVPN